MITKIKKQILKNLKNTYCRLRPSATHGVGVFAIRDIPRGVKPFAGIFDQPWHRFNLSELVGLDPVVKGLIDDFFVIEKDGTVFIPRHGLNGMDLSFFVNNAKKPNLRVVYTKAGVTEFVAARKIKKGEELLAAYADYDDKYQAGGLEKVSRKKF